MSLTLGILQPAFSSQWAIRFPQPLQILSMQAVSIEINYVTHEIKLVIESSASGSEHKELEKLIERAGEYSTMPLFVDMLGTGANVLHTLQFINAQVLDHTYNLNYGHAQIATHRLHIKYKSMHVISKE